MAPMRFSDYLCTELRAEAVHAALQLLITNKGCIVYQHLQSAPGTRCSASCFLISDLGSGLQCCSAAVLQWTVFMEMAGTSAADYCSEVTREMIEFSPLCRRG